MEDSISTFSKSIATFCNHLQSSCDALKQSIDRRPIPLDSASSTFIQCLNRRATSASSDLNLLESMSFGTVSFEELLGHCNEVYKKNQSDLAELEDHLKSTGYVPEFVVDDEDELPTNLSTPGLQLKPPYPKNEFGLPSSYHGSVSATGSVMQNFKEGAIFDESMSLESVGLSDVCLANLASKGNGNLDDSEVAFHEPMKLSDKPFDLNVLHQHAVHESVEADSPAIKLSKDDFESLPSYMKGLVSWEDLLVAVEKINSSLNQKTKGENFIRQDEISSLELGPKARSYLLLLVRLKRLIVETLDGLIYYRVL